MTFLIPMAIGALLTWFGYTLGHKDGYLDCQNDVEHFMLHGGLNRHIAQQEWALFMQQQRRKEINGTQKG